MDGDDRSNSTVYITLRELYDLLCDTRERLVIMANDMRWVKDVSDGFDDRVNGLQEEIKELWAENAAIRSQLGDAKSAHSGLMVTLKTAASIGSFLLSIGVAIYVAFVSSGR